MNILLEKAKQVYEDNKQLFEDLGISSFESVHKELQRATWLNTLSEYGYNNLSYLRIECKGDNEIHLRLNDYMYIASMGQKYYRTISWSDDKRQPEDEVMLVISFPTGPYIFGSDYLPKLFEEFFEELKSYGYKYLDTINKNIYFSVETGAKVANEFKEVMNKYCEKHRQGANKRKIDRLREELRLLEENEDN